MNDLPARAICTVPHLERPRASPPPCSLKGVREVSPGAGTSGVRPGVTTTVGALLALPRLLKEIAGLRVTKINGFRVSDLRESGNAMDRNGLTAAERSAQEHGDRSGSGFPQIPGSVSAAERNAHGDAILNQILSDPNKTNSGAKT